MDNKIQEIDFSKIDPKDLTREQLELLFYQAATEVSCGRSKIAKLEKENDLLQSHVSTLLERLKTAEAASMTKPLTGLLNVAGAEVDTAKLNNDIYRFNRNGIERNHGVMKYMGCVRIDLDHFKNLNDTLGHAAGDIALQRVAQIITTQARDCDVPVHDGGDEFAVFLDIEAKNEVEAMLFTAGFAERVRKDIVAMAKKNKWKLSASIGADVYFPISSIDSPPKTASEVDRKNLFFKERLKVADKCGYVAKNNGRNAVIYSIEGVSYKAEDNLPVRAQAVPGKKTSRQRQPQQG